MVVDQRPSVSGSPSPTFCCNPLPARPAIPNWPPQSTVAGEGSLRCHAGWGRRGARGTTVPCPQHPVLVLGATRGPWWAAQAAQGPHGTWGRGCTHGLQLVPLVSPPPTLPVPRAPGRCAAPSLRNAEQDTRAGISGAAQPRSPTRPPAACPLPYLAARGRRLGGCGAGGGSVCPPRGRAAGGCGLVHAGRHQPCAGTAQGPERRDRAGARVERNTPATSLHPGTFTLSLVGAPCGSSAAPEGHFFTSCP